MLFNSACIKYDKINEMINSHSARRAESTIFLSRMVIGILLMNVNYTGKEIWTSFARVPS